MENPNKLNTIYVMTEEQRAELMKLLANTLTYAQTVGSINMLLGLQKIEPKKVPDKEDDKEKGQSKTDKS